MMESIRAGIQKPWVKVLLGITVLSFVFAGYFTSPGVSGSPDAVAEVNGEEIRQNEWNNAVQAEAARYGEQFNAFFSTDEAKAQFRLSALEKLINSKVVAQEVSEYGFRASDEQIIQQVAQIPAFQMDGKYSASLMDQLLIQRGWSRESFKSMIAQDIQQAQFIQIFADTESAFPYEVAQRVALDQQTRDAQSLTIAHSSFSEQVEITEDDILAYYQSNIADFEITEKVIVDYIELTTEQIKSAIEVSDADVQAYYDHNQDLYRSEEERRVAHILIKTEERSDEEAEELIKQVVNDLASGQDFSEVAKQRSEDFSADQGGDLGFVGKGVMDSEFEQAMFSLQAAGDVSGVVKTEFGFHVIKLLEIQAGEVKALEQVKEQIVDRIKSDKAEQEFYVKKDKIAQLAFDNYDSLTAAAAEAELPILTSEAFTRTGGLGVFSHADVVTEAFSTAVLQDGRNSGAIDVSETEAVVLRLKEYTPSRTKALDEVKAEVTSALRARKSREAAQSFGELLIAKLNAGESIETELAEKNIAWNSAEKISRNSTEFGFELARIAFKAPKPVNDTPIAVGEALMSGDFAVVRVTGIHTVSADAIAEAQKNQAKARVSRAMTDANYSSLVKAVREKSSIKKFEDRIQ